MATYRLVKGKWIDVDFATDAETRLVKGDWVESQAAPPAAASGVFDIFNPGIIASATDE